MTTNKHKITKSKIVLIIITAVIFILLLCVLAGWLLFKSYLGKIDYDHAADSSAASRTENTLSDEEIMKELLAEETDTDESDSPEEDIAQLESQMEEQLKESVDDEDISDDENIFNVLLVGSDTRKKGGVGRSDTMILVSVNEETEKIHMTSIMRDSYVAIPNKGNNRINAAYAFGGGSLLLDTIETNFAVNVDRYVAFDFYSFIDVVDSVGGIDINVSDEEIPVLNDYVRSLNELYGRDEETYLLSEGGLLHLNGTQALGYARIRYVGNGDFERTERQRKVIDAVFKKAKTMNVFEINELLNVLLPEIKTNLTEAEITSLLLKAMTYLEYELDSMRLPIDGSYESMRVNDMSVLGINLEKNQDALIEFIYN